jgi:hypothetical protein
LRRDEADRHTDENCGGQQFDPRHAVTTSL